MKLDISSLSRHRGTVVTGTLAALLATGWSVREAQFAVAQGKRVPNITLNAKDVAAEAAAYEGKTVGKASTYYMGETATLKSLHVGRFELAPGSEPHPPHKHPEEEVLIVSGGQGEVYCNGKTVAVKAGAVMYSDPNVEHGIKNTGAKPLEFYWVKWAPAK